MFLRLNNISYLSSIKQKFIIAHFCFLSQLAYNSEILLLLSAKLPRKNSLYKNTSLKPSLFASRFTPKNAETDTFYIEKGKDIFDKVLGVIGFTGLESSVGAGVDCTMGLSRGQTKQA